MMKSLAIRIVVVLGAVSLALARNSAQAAERCSLVFESPVAIDYSIAAPPLESAVYGSADQTFAHKFALLEAAEHSILISTFSIKPDAWYAHDAIGKTLADILIEKHHQGLEVKVFTDYWGNPPSTRAEIKRMIKGGVDVRYFGTPTNFFDLMVKLYRAARHLNIENLNHGKTVVIDGWHTFTGGYNWMSGQTAGVKSWRDTDFYISGPIAEKVSLDFYKIFETLPKLVREPPSAQTSYRYPKDSVPTDEFLMQAPWLDGGREPINEKILRLINDAQAGDEIYWQSFAFRPQPPQLEAIRQAAARGVKITILTNSKENLYKQLFFIAVPAVRRMLVERMYAAAAQTFPQLLDASSTVPIRLMQFKGEDGPMHAKAFLLIKAETARTLEAGTSPPRFIGEAGAGTYNVSPNSWNQHIETMFFSQRSNLVSGLYQLYLQDISHSVPISR